MDYLTLPDPQRSDPDHDVITAWLDTHKETILAAWYGDPQTRPSYGNQPPIRDRIDDITAQREAVLLALAHRKAAIQATYAELDATRPGRAYGEAERNRQQAIRVPHRDAQEALRLSEHAARDQNLAAVQHLLNGLASWAAYQTVPTDPALGAILHARWEAPLCDGMPGPILAFADYALAAVGAPLLRLEAEGGLARLWYDGNLQESALAEALELEDQATAEPVRWLHPDYLPYWYAAPVEDRLYFEVEPGIPSLGDLLRRLGTMAACGDTAPWIVVSWDAWPAQTILDQGYGFIHYDEDAPPVVYKPGSRYPAV